MSQYLANTVSLVCSEVTGSEPISLDDAKLYLRVDTDADDDLITMMISAARAEAEGKTRRIIRQSTWQWVSSEIVVPSQVPVTPCSACTSVVVDGAEVDTSLYEFTPGGISVPLFATIVPLVDFPKGQAVLTLSCGYADGEVPVDMVKWMFTRLGDFYEQRESYVSGSNFFEFSRNFVDALLDPYLIPDC